jgi:hypothetical protein
MWILAHRCPPPPIGNADQTLCANNMFCGFFSCSVRHSYWRRVRRCAIILADCKEDERVLCASPIFKPIAYKLSISNRRRKYLHYFTRNLFTKTISVLQYVGRHFIFLKLQYSFNSASLWTKTTTIISLQCFLYHIRCRSSPLRHMK